MRAHVLAVGAVDQDRLGGTQPFRHPRGIHGRVARADDADDASELGRVPLLDLLQQLERVDHAAAVHRRDVHVVADLRADGQEHRVEATVLLLRQHVVHAVVAGHHHAHRPDALDLLHQAVSRKAVLRDAVMHHAARLRACVLDLDVVAHALKVVRARQAARPGADDQHALGRRRLDRNPPSFFRREIAEEAIQRVDRNRLVQLRAVAGAFAGVIARAAVRPRQGVLLHVFLPRRLVSPRLREVEPGLDVLAGRTCVVARRKEVDVDGPLPPRRAGPLPDRRLVDRGDVFRNQAHRAGSRNAGRRDRALRLTIAKRKPAPAGRA